MCSENSHTIGSCSHSPPPFWNSAPFPGTGPRLLLSGFQLISQPQSTNWHTVKMYENKTCIFSLKQSELVAVTENVQQKHSYNNELENINTKLNPPTRSVNSEGFIPMLWKLDDSIEAVSSYWDHPVYLTKFQQCLSKALHEDSHWERYAESHQPTMPLHCVKFRAAAPKVRVSRIIYLFYPCSVIPRYHQLSEEIHQCYLDQREQLLSLIITATISDLTSQNNKDHYALVPCGFAFMFHISQDEHQLYTDFFSKPTHRLEEVLELLEKLCLSLYDVLRLLIIHGIHLETMSELCGILNNEMLQDHVHNKNAGQLGVFEAVVKQMLEDVQERLVYRTHIYIQTDIIGDNPAPRDLAYPEKLERMELQSLPSDHSFYHVKIVKYAQKNWIKTAIDSSHFQPYVSPTDLHGMWYPTVRRTLVCLSKFYMCVDRAAFLGLSQEALSACIQSLLKASDVILKNKIAADLFQGTFHTDFAIMEISLDLKRTRDAAFKMMNPKSVPSFFRLYSPNAILECLLEVKFFRLCLKSLQQRFVKLFGFLQMIFERESCKRDILSLSENHGGGPTHNLSQQPWITINDIVMPTFRVTKSKLPSTLQSMSLYRANGDTEFILFKPVRNNIQQEFQRLHTVIQEGYSGEDLQIIACSSMEEINLLLSVNK
uniref:Conserved oligomeric Golgi complex subunit 3 n=1 Tax=Oncorhynchus kisutch TaxID=8019 RepID=A0A8C7DLR0_ONCKI